jgi:hypothetical protein
MGFLLLAAAAPAEERATPAGTTPPGSPATPGGGAEDTKRFQAAFKVIETSTKTREIVEAMQVIREGFPSTRPLLHQHAAKGSVKEKCFALQVLGEQGTVEQDLEIVTSALKDPHPRTRLSAVMAVRKLGKDGLRPLLDYLPGESEANNKKMAIKTLQHWGDKAALPALVRLLKTEKDNGVREFLVTALEFITRQRFGGDAAAWETYLVNEADRQQALDLLKPKAGKEAEKP